jgi:hypothetical protein
MSKVPEEGKTYTIAKYLNGTALLSSITYKGCSLEKSWSILNSLKGRLIAKEFYINDYTLGNNSQPEYQSTVYWAPFLQISSTKDTEVSFYTSDLKAPYRVVVQGLSEKQVVTGATTFRVE